jgi:hypothetical protein
VKLTTRTFRAEDLYIHFLIFLHGLHRNNFIFILLCMYLFIRLFKGASSRSHILAVECQGGSESLAMERPCANTSRLSSGVSLFLMTDILLNKTKCLNLPSKHKPVCFDGKFKHFVSL